MSKPPTTYQKYVNIVTSRRPYIKNGVQESSTDFGNAANMAVMRLKDDINKLLCENGFDW